MKKNHFTMLFNALVLALTSYAVNAEPQASNQDVAVPVKEAAQQKQAANTTRRFGRQTNKAASNAATPNVTQAEAQPAQVQPASAIVAPPPDRARANAQNAAPPPRTINITDPRAKSALQQDVMTDRKPQQGAVKDRPVAAVPPRTNAQNAAPPPRPPSRTDTRKKESSVGIWDYKIPKAQKQARPATIAPPPGQARDVAIPAHQSKQNAAVPGTASQPHIYVKNGVTYATRPKAGETLPRPGARETSNQRDPHSQPGGPSKLVTKGGHTYWETAPRKQANQSAKEKNQPKLVIKDGHIYNEVSRKPVNQ